MENNEGVNLLMVEYEENVNVVAKINTELCKMYGLEHYLTEFSSNLITALNQYKRFVLLMNERKKFVEGLLDFSNKLFSDLPYVTPIYENYSFLLRMKKRFE